MTLSGDMSSYSIAELELIHSDLDSKISHPTKHRLGRTETTKLKKHKLRVKEELHRRERDTA